MFLAQYYEETLDPHEKNHSPALAYQTTLMKQFLKTLDKSSQCFQSMCQKFPGLSIEKIKGVTLDGP